MMHGDRWLVVFYFIFFFHVILRSSFCLLSLVPFPCRKFFCFGFGVVIVRRHFSLRHLPLHIFHWFFLFLTENFIKIFVFCSCVPPICVLVLCQCVHALPLLLFLWYRLGRWIAISSLDFDLSLDLAFCRLTSSLSFSFDLVCLVTLFVLWPCFVSSFDVVVLC